MSGIVMRRASHSGAPQWYAIGNTNRDGDSGSHDCQALAVAVRRWRGVAWAVPCGPTLVRSTYRPLVAPPCLLVSRPVRWFCVVLFHILCTGIKKCCRVDVKRALSVTARSLKSHGLPCRHDHPHRAASAGALIERSHGDVSAHQHLQAQLLTHPPFSKPHSHPRPP